MWTHFCIVTFFLLWKYNVPKKSEIYSLPLCPIVITLVYLTGYSPAPMQCTKSSDMCTDLWERYYWHPFTHDCTSCLKVKCICSSSEFLAKRANFIFSQQKLHTETTNENSGWLLYLLGPKGLIWDSIGRDRRCLAMWASAATSSWAEAVKHCTARTGAQI